MDIQREELRNLAYIFALASGSVWSEEAVKSLNKFLRNEGKNTEREMSMEELNAFFRM